MDIKIKDLKMKKVLITSVNYADEFDVPVVSIFTKKEYKAIKIAAKGKKKKSMEICFGTNESIEGTVGEFVDMLDSAVDVNKKEMAVLLKFGVNNIYGTIDIVSELQDRLKINQDNEDNIPY